MSSQDQIPTKRKVDIEQDVIEACRTWISEDGLWTDEEVAHIFRNNTDYQLADGMLRDVETDETLEKLELIFRILREEYS